MGWNEGSRPHPPQSQSRAGSRRSPRRSNRCPKCTARTSVRASPTCKCCWGRWHMRRPSSRRSASRCTAPGSAARRWCSNCCARSPREAAATRAVHRVASSRPRRGRAHTWRRRWRVQSSLLRICSARRLSTLLRKCFSSGTTRRRGCHPATSRSGFRGTDTGRGSSTLLRRCSRPGMARTRLGCRRPRQRCMCPIRRDSSRPASTSGPAGTPRTR